MNILNSFYEVIIHIILIIFIELLIYFTIFKKKLEKVLNLQNDHELYLLIKNNKKLSSVIKNIYSNKNDEKILSYIEHYNLIEKDKNRIYNQKIISYAVILQLVLLVLLLLTITIAKSLKIVLKLNYIKTSATLIFLLIIELIFVFKLNMLLKENEIELILELIKDFRNLLKFPQNFLKLF
tara:strand:- start:1185 stop:1727 length:543 start_codon:yes stop_codon:yes gene_type:complete